MCVTSHCWTGSIGTSATICCSKNIYTLKMCVGDCGAFSSQTARVSAVSSKEQIKVPITETDIR